MTALQRKIVSHVVLDLGNSQNHHGSIKDSDLGVHRSSKGGLSKGTYNKIEARTAARQ
ncbi:MAG: hypothetical protein AAF600_08325 [Bacteroidota bacterium]